MPPIDRGILLGRRCRSGRESKIDHQRFWRRNRNPLMEKRKRQDQQRRSINTGQRLGKTKGGKKRSTYLSSGHTLADEDQHPDPA